MTPRKTVLTFVCCALVGALLIPGTTVLAGDTPQEVLDRVRKHYESIRDAEIHFTQNVKFAVAKVEQQTSGIVYLKKDNHYRVEVGDHTIVTDGKTVWSFSLPNNQVLIDNYKVDDRALTPERVLFGAPSDFTPSLLGSEKLGKYKTTVLKLIPRSDRLLVKTLKVWVDETDMIRKVEMIDLNGKETVYMVNDARFNTGLQDSRFVFQIPEGAEVVDLR